MDIIVNTLDTVLLNTFGCCESYVHRVGCVREKTLRHCIIVYKVKTGCVSVHLEHTHLGLLCTNLADSRVSCECKQTVWLQNSKSVDC